jgi:hypothetical protein
MKTFTDNVGRTWTVTVNVEAVKRVRGLLSVDLLEVLDGKLLERLAADPILLCDLVYCLCKSEADAKGVTDEEFGRAMAGDAIDGAMVALMEELVGFFPRERRRLLARALEKLRMLETRAVDVAMRKLESPALERELDEELARLTDSSGSSPEFSVSTPGR